MRRLALCATLIWVALTTAPALPASRLAPEVAKFLQAGLSVTAEAFILPGYTRLAEETRRLEAALVAFCASETSADIAPAHDAFAASFLAWQRISAIQTGPIMEAEGPMRVQLWPDPKGFSHRAIRAATAAADPALLEPGALEGRSIALVSLTALEALLYPAPEPGSYPCDLASAIARFQSTLAADLAAQWSPGAAFRTDFDSAYPGNARYPDTKTLIRELLAGLVVYTDRLRKFKIQRGLGSAPGEARASRTEATRSGLGLASLQTGFETLAELYRIPGGLFERTQSLGGSMDHLHLSQTATSIADTLAFMPASLEAIAAEDGLMAAQVRQFAPFVTLHEDYVKTGLPRSIGLTSGFTSADGD